MIYQHLFHNTVKITMADTYSLIKYKKLENYTSLEK